MDSVDVVKPLLIRPSLFLLSSSSANEPKADPMYQPALLKNASFDTKTLDIPVEYKAQSSIVAGQTI